MKILVIINEKFSDSILGRNTTLGYVLAAVEAGHEVYILEIDAQKNFLQTEIEALYLNYENDFALVAAYKIHNDDLSLEMQRVGAIYHKKLNHKKISLEQIDFVIQRLEPMKAPFPPVGKLSIEKYLADLEKLFPQNFIFNNPNDCFGDKELPLMIDGGGLATPTVATYFGDEKMTQKVNFIAQKYQQIFQNERKKIVVKPNNSAQTLGIFSIEFVNDCQLNLTNLREKTVAELIDTQSYKIAIKPEDKSFEDVLKILCFVQFCKNNAVNYNGQLKFISDDEITQKARLLYNDKILLQPFLEGVAKGDVRVSLAKLSDGNFHVVGAIFRQSIKFDDKNFTTCLTAGQSEAKLIEDCLTIDEKNHLKQSVNYILQKLNGDLKEKYRACLEIGLDFILSGNQKTVYFGEANHHCPATMTVSEAVHKKAANGFFSEINGLQVPYNGGLGIVSEIVRQQIILQKKANENLFSAD